MVATPGAACQESLRRAARSAPGAPGCASGASTPPGGPARARGALSKRSWGRRRRRAWVPRTGKASGSLRTSSSILLADRAVLVSGLLKISAKS